MEFRRKAYDYLLEWRGRSNRKPLVIRGARQVGKTTLVRQFASEYDSYLEVNLEKKRYRDLFLRLNDPRTVFEALLLMENVTPGNGPVLLFLDEIQESPQAIAMLRYFYEEMPRVHVVAAGSLLEFTIREIPSFPVGRVDQMALHPLDFGEFLLATGDEKAFGYLNSIPVTEIAHSFLMERFHAYTITGGMPEIVSLYSRERSYALLKSAFDSLWQGYRDDAAKYATNTTDRKILRHIFDTAPMATDRITFERFGGSEYRSREVGDIFRMLDNTGIMRLVYPSTSMEPPIVTDTRKRPRLQFVDTGLLNHVLGVQAGLVQMTDLSDAYRGKIVQHLVTQELIAQHDSPSYRPHFWVREKSNSSAEVDLLYNHRDKIIPIEIKSGEAGKLRSLHQFIDSSKHNLAIRLLGNNLSVDRVKTAGGTPFVLLNLPYYLGSRIPQYAEWLVEKR